MGTAERICCSEKSLHAEMTEEEMVVDTWAAPRSNIEKNKEETKNAIQ